VRKERVVRGGFGQFHERVGDATEVLVGETDHAARAHCRILVERGFRVSPVERGPARAICRHWDEAGAGPQTGPRIRRSQCCRLLVVARRGRGVRVRAATIAAAVAARVGVRAALAVAVARLGTWRPGQC